MSFLDKIVLPQSLEHITLLHFLIILVMMFFVPFLSIILGGSLFSLFFRRKGTEESNPLYMRFSTEIIELTTLNKSAALGLGVAPVVMIILSYTQLLHGLPLIPVKYFLLSFLLITTGLILLFTFRYSAFFRNLFINYTQAENSSLIAAEGMIGKINRLYESSGKWGLFFVLTGSFFFTAGVTAALFAGDALAFDSFWSVFASITVYTRWLYLLSAALSLTGALILFTSFYWEGGRELESDYAEVIRRISLKAIMVFTLLQPIFLVINVISYPAVSLSFAVFGLSFLALVLLFISYHLVYYMIRHNTGRFNAAVFVLLMLTVFAVLTAEQTAFSNATGKQSLILSAQFTEAAALLEKQSAGPGSISGAEIFKTKCSACHSFTNKVVGPPYKETLPKYQGNLDKLVAFVKNPVKINPAYPAMPNQGLKPAEVRAIAKYILEEVKKY